MYCMLRCKISMYVPTHSGQYRLSSTIAYDCVWLGRFAGTCMYVGTCVLLCRFAHNYTTCHRVISCCILLVYWCGGLLACALAYALPHAGMSMCNVYKFWHPVPIPQAGVVVNTFHSFIHLADVLGADISPRDFLPRVLGIFLRFLGKGEHRAEVCSVDNVGV